MSLDLTDEIPDLRKLRYEPRNFSDLAATELGKELWAFLTNPITVIRMETATILERPALEPLGPSLIRRFGEHIRDDRTKQMIGHMARQVMAALGYTLAKTDTRVTRIGLFTTAASYKRIGKSAKPMKVTAEQRAAWVQNTRSSPFNVWLDGQVKERDGTLNLEKLYAVARRYGIAKRYDGLNPGQQRMNIGVQLRRRVDKTEYEA